MHVEGSFTRATPKRLGVHRVLRYYAHGHVITFQNWNGTYWGQYVGTEEVAASPRYAGTQSFEQNPLWDMDFVPEIERKQVIDISRPAKTEAGRDVTFITDKGRGDYPIIGYIGGAPHLTFWKADGESGTGRSECNLVQERVKWLVVYRNGNTGVFDDEAQAKKPTVSSIVSRVRVVYKDGQMD